MFFINDKAGIAYACVEGGIAKWRPEDKDFTRLMSSAEMDALPPLSRNVSEDEAIDFMLAKDAASGAAAPRA